MNYEEPSLINYIYDALYYKDYKNLIRYIDKIKETDFEIYKDILTIIGDINYMHIELENLVEELIINSNVKEV